MTHDRPPSEPVDEGERARLLEESVASVEQPAASACAAIASARAAGDPEVAARWAVRAVDGGSDFTAWRSAARVLDRVLPGRAPEEVRSLRVAILGTSTISPILPTVRLALAHERVGATLYEAPYGQYWQEALDPASGLWTFEPDVVVLIPDHRALGRASIIDDHSGWLSEELVLFTGLWSHITERCGADVVQVSFAEPAEDPLGSLAASVPGSRRARLRELNRSLAGAARDALVGFVDAEAVAARVGKAAWFDDRYWHVAKHAVALGAVPDLGRQIASVIAARVGRSRKCLVFDLDNTVWGGVIGDDGVDGIELSGTQGEAFIDLQHAIVDLGRRGVVLAVCTKNDDAAARQPFDEHPDMVLSLDQIAAFDASWDPKPVALRRIASSLQLAADALLFLDDNPAEREAVRRALPEVEVLALPPDPASWASVLTGHASLQPASLTAEDGQRTAQYQARAKAAELERSSESLEEFLESLTMTAEVGSLDGVDLDRAAQLIAKTNQFNLTTQRHPPERVGAIADDEGWASFGIRLSDRFADHGLIAVVLAEVVDDALEVDTLVMSCRVIGRGVEHVAVAELVDQARRRGLSRLRATYVPTERNGLVADLWTRLGLSEIDRDEGGTVTYALDDLHRADTRSTITVEHLSP